MTRSGNVPASGTTTGALMSWNAREPDREENAPVGKVRRKKVPVVAEVAQNQSSFVSAVVSFTIEMPNVPSPIVTGDASVASYRNTLNPEALFSGILLPVSTRLGLPTAKTSPVRGVAFGVPAVVSKKEIVNTSSVVGVSSKAYTPNHRTVLNVVVAPNVKFSARKRFVFGSLWIRVYEIRVAVVKDHGLRGGGCGEKVCGEDKASIDSDRGDYTLNSDERRATSDEGTTHARTWDNIKEIS